MPPWGLYAWMVNTKPEIWSIKCCWDCLRFGGGGIIKNSLHNDFISLGLKAWVALVAKSQRFWDVLIHDMWGVVLGRSLIFFLLWLPLIAYMTVSGSPARVCCVNFIFPLCQHDPGKSMGRSLPFPPFLPICCGLHLFVLRVKGTEHFAQITTPLLENDA